MSLLAKECTEVGWNATRGEKGRKDLAMKKIIAGMPLTPFSFERFFLWIDLPQLAPQIKSTIVKVVDGTYERGSLCKVPEHYSYSKQPHQSRHKEPLM